MARKAPGQPLRWTDADLDRLAQVTPEDVQAASIAISQRLPARLAALWDAKPTTLAPAPTSGRRTRQRRT